MSTQSKSAPGYVQPLSTGGIGALLISLSSHAPSEYREALILLATFASPFLVAIGLKLFAFFNVPNELIQYKATLKRDLKAAKTELKSEGLTEEHKKELTDFIQKTRMLHLRANQDYYSGALQLSPVTLPGSQPSAQRVDS